MPAKNHKKCGHSHSHTNSPSSPHITSISNLVSKSPNTVTPNKKSEFATLTRCPHVCLIGNIYIDDITPQNLLQIKLTEQLKNVKNEPSNEMDVNQSNEDLSSSLIENKSGSKRTEALQCDECEQSRNLWLCLRENCMFVGCGGKEHESYRHSTVHAQNSFHPLAINLVTKAIWCEFCNNKIILDRNEPMSQLLTRKEKEQSDRQRTQSGQYFRDNPQTDREHFDDLELIGYLDQECNRTSRLDKIFGLNNKKIRFKQNSNFLFNYNVADDSDQNDEYETDDKLNNFFMYDEEMEDKKKWAQRNGQIGLDNLGNTCYMNSALQSLSNCPSMTSYFLECSDYIQMRILYKSNYFDAYSTSNSKSSSSTILPCLSLSYIKLMRELWEDKKVNKNGKNNKNRRITSFSPNEFVQVVKYLNPMFRGYMQHDSQEFLCYLMDQLHEELKRPVYTDDSLKLIDSETETESDSDSDENNQNADANSKKIQSSDQPALKSYSSNEVDSGIHRLSIKSSTTQSSLASIQSVITQSSQPDDDESADSFETCIGESMKKENTQSDLSDSNFSDAADDTISTNENNTMSKVIEQSKTKLKIKKKKKNKPNNPVYSSAISDLFEGRLIGQVQCLECRSLSTRTESFQHLSLPIPTKEYLQTLQNKAIQRSSYTDRSISASDSSSGQGWLGWMADIVKGYLWTPTIKLQECLMAFFSDDDLRGDNMYSCEKCKKLTNGVKYSKLLKLPEILIIHLKRFRHDSMFSTGKISSYVSFPLDDLDMKPYLHVSNKNRNNLTRYETEYELCSITCHYGSSNGGHYIAYARNYLNEEWYEYDDSYCKKVDILTVQNTQAYVLFYRKKSLKMDHIKDQLRSQIIAKTSLTLENSLLQSNYISKQWLQKLKYFAEPGPIDNTDFLCKHNFVQPCFWQNIDSMVVRCSTDTWMYLLKTFGIKRIKIDSEEEDIDIESDGSDADGEMESNLGVCNYLYPCRQCQIDDELMKQRQIFEKNEFLRLTEKTRLNQLFQNSNSPYKNHIAPMSGNGIRLFAISSNWFKQWEQFVQFKHCPQKHQIPGAINNLPICNQQLLKNKIYQLNKNSNYYKLTEEVWTFLHEIYGGGPSLLVNGPHTTRQSSRAMSTSSTLSMNSTN